MRIISLLRKLLNELYDEMVYLDEGISSLENKLKTISHQNDDCQRLLTISGVGLLTATALIAAIGNISVFRSGRISAMVRLGSEATLNGIGMPTLMGISKRGDCYLRTLLIHGGRTVVRVAHLYTDKRNLSVSELDQRRGKNISAVAVANKNARLAWALLSKKESYAVTAI